MSGVGVGDGVACRVPSLLSLVRAAKMCAQKIILTHYIIYLTYKNEITHYLCIPVSLL